MKHHTATQTPPLTIDVILAWADQHHQATGTWPRVGSGPIAGQPGETWLVVNRALQQGERGLPGGSSLPTLLRERRGVTAWGGFSLTPTNARPAN